MRWAIIGAAGYIAPRHMEAIKVVGGELVAIVDPHDSVGVVDHFGFSPLYFSRVEEMVEGFSGKLEYVAVCSPNHLHLAHCMRALEMGCDVLCEKPLVYLPGDYEQLVAAAKKAQKEVYTVSQLRYHKDVAALRGYVPKQVHAVYSVVRGPWYFRSWKADRSLSGGLEVNIGAHLFDLCAWLWGVPKYMTVGRLADSDLQGKLYYSWGEVKWRMSVLPVGESPTRMLNVDGRFVDLSAGPPEPHVTSYRELLAGRGIPLSAMKETVDFLHELGRM